MGLKYLKSHLGYKYIVGGLSSLNKPSIKTVV